MAKLHAWLQQRGFSLRVIPNAVDRVVLLAEGGGEVTLDRTRPAANRICTLLHECGHVIVDARRRAVRATRRRHAGATLREVFHGTGRLRPRRLACDLAELHEELEAWEAGEALARRLKVRFSRATFERERAQALMTYVRATARTRR